MHLTFRSRRIPAYLYVLIASEQNMDDLSSAGVSVKNASATSRQLLGRKLVKTGSRPSAEIICHVRLSISRRDLRVWIVIRGRGTSKFELWLWCIRESLRKLRAVESRTSFLVGRTAICHFKLANVRGGWLIQVGGGCLGSSVLAGSSNGYRN